LAAVLIVPEKAPKMMKKRRAGVLLATTLASRVDG
jgi:hypothetical protein